MKPPKKAKEVKNKYFDKKNDSQKENVNNFQNDSNQNKNKTEIIQTIQNSEKDDSRAKSRKIKWGGAIMILIILFLECAGILYLHMKQNAFYILMSHYKEKNQIEEEPDFNIEIVSGEEMDEVSAESLVNEADLADEHISDFKLASVDKCTPSEEYTTESPESKELTSSENVNSEASVVTEEISTSSATKYSDILMEASEDPNTAQVNVRESANKENKNLNATEESVELAAELSS